MSNYPDNMNSAGFAHIDAGGVLDRLPGSALSAARAAFAVSELARKAWLYEAADRAMADAKSALGEHLDGDDIQHACDELDNEMAHYSVSALAQHVDDEARRLEAAEQRRTARVAAARSKGAA